MHRTIQRLIYSSPEFSSRLSPPHFQGLFVRPYYSQAGEITYTQMLAIPTSSPTSDLLRQIKFGRVCPGDVETRLE